MTSRRRLLIALGASALALAMTFALAAEYPVKPIRVITGFAAGGPSDISARIIAQILTAAWGQQVIVDIRRGNS